MRDFGSFLNDMAPEQPKPEPQQYPDYDEEAEQQEFQQSQSDIPMDPVTPAQGYSDFGSAPQQTFAMDEPVGQPAPMDMGMNGGMGGMNGMNGEPSNIPMESAEPVNTQKRYSAEDYERATNYDYATRSTQGTYQTIRERRSTLSRNSDENMGMGIVGTLLGAVLGTGIWYLIGLTGFISSWGALAIVVCCFFGYTLFAKGFGAGGALVVGIAIIVSVFCGIRLCYGHMIVESQKELRSDTKLLEEYDMEPEDVYVPTLIEASFTQFGSIIDSYDDVGAVRKAYESDLGTSYLYTGIAAIVFFVRRMRH